jgi:hypothetical protein
VHREEALSDAILFEIPQGPAAADLCRHLEPRWPGSLNRDDGRWIVVVRLRPVKDDAALLLRTVESWVVERGLEELWFQLDGRSYLLRARRVDHSTAKPV